MSQVFIYFEGDRKLQEGFRQFLNEIYVEAKIRHAKIRLVSGNSKSETIKDFIKAVRVMPDAFNVMLVDSDRPVSDTSSLISQVKQHTDWDNSLTVPDAQLHFMVQVMESWFLADKSALEGYYGRLFRANRLPQNTNVEQIPKSDVESGLRSATRETGKGAYHKTRHAPELLARIDPSRVRGVAPHCDRLLRELEQALV
ncbi:MAG: DUF4276 family protein [Chloroflexi bacterium]|nr:DUF4276 family protein [Chloroflexota bacterium]